MAQSQITTAQAKYIGVLATQLGYASVYDMWEEYGYMEVTPWGRKPRPCSKIGASDVIGKLKARINQASNA